MPKIFDHRKKAPRSVLIAGLAAFSLLAGAASAESSSPASAPAMEIGHGSADATAVPALKSLAPPQTAAKTSRPAVGASYGNLPIAFELNQGQTDARVKFFARGQGYGLYLNAAEAVLDLHRSADGPALSPQKAKPHVVGAKAGVPEAQGESAHAAVRMSLRGANAAAPATGLDPQPGVSNYLIGNDPEKWHTKIQHYGKVRYAGVYPGIDLVYYGNQQQLEYDFIVAPGADPAAIKLDFDGVDKLGIDAEGNLVLAAAGGKVVQHKPVIYQTIEGQRKRIDGGYVVRGNHAAFHVAAYDKSQALTIDPTLAYSTYLGNAGPNSAYAVAVDGSGAVYIAGSTFSNGYPVTVGALEPKANLGKNTVATDGFISKLSADGKSLEYSTYLGGSGSDEIFRMLVDAQGHAYVAGFTASADFPTTSGVVQRKYGGNGSNSISLAIGDGFVAELAVDGGSLKFSTFLGGSGDDPAFALALDPGGNVYVAGETTSNDFPTTPGAYQPLPVNKLITSSASPATNAYVVKLNPDASQLVYSTFIGIDATQGAYNLAVDAAGDAYVVGQTSSIHFPVTAGVFQPAAGHPANSIYSIGFVLKLNPAGSALTYSTYLGNYSEAVDSIALDAGGNAYVAGWSQSPNFPTTPGAFQTTHPEWSVNTSAFVSKINPTATALIYSTYVHGVGSASDSYYAATGFQGTNTNIAASNIVSVDADGNAYLVSSAGGSYGDPKLPVTPDAYQSKYAGSDDAFVVELNPAGSGLLYASYLGGSGTDTPFGAVLMPGGSLYIAGGTASTDFPTTANAYQTKSPGTVTNYGSWNFVSQLVFSAAVGYTVGGTVSGLAGSGLGLSLNGGSQTLALNADGSFAFPAALADGSPYAVTISSQPSASPAQTCTVSHGSGSIAEANVNNIAVTCAALASNYIIGGTVSGLAGSGLVLSLNNGAQTLPVGANGSFAFPAALANGSAYAVSVATQPAAPAQSCSVSNGSGTVAGANVTNVGVVCSTSSPGYVVTPSAGANGSISPAVAQTVASGATATFTVTPSNGYRASVGGSCGGSLSGATYTTNAVTADCSVVASFAPIALVSTTTTLTATPNPVQAGQPLTLIATVTTNAVTNGSVKRVAAAAGVAAAPTGTVTFKNGSSIVGTAGLAGGGVATLTVPNLAPGTYGFSALYSGDANDSASASAVPLSVTVNASSPAATIPAPATTAWGWIAMCLGLVGIGSMRRRRA